MSIIRMRLCSPALLGVLAVGIPVFGSLLATPAAAMCLGGCGFGIHRGAASAMFARRQMAPSLAMPANHGMVRLHQRPSSATLSTSTSAARAIRARSLASASATTTSVASKTPHISGDICKKMHSCISIPKANTDIAPGGPSTTAIQAPSFGQGGGGNASAGGAGLATSRGNGSSGLAPVSAPSSGGGPGQFTTAGGSANNSAGAAKSLDGPASNRPSTVGASTTRTETTPNATTPSTTKGSTTAPNTGTTTLTAVTVCMTRAGSCPMERDIGTACQCKDPRGNLYDGIVK